MRTKTISAYELKVHSWWHDTQVYSDYFFDMTASLQFDYDRIDSDMITTFHELNMIRASYEEADYPSCATTARQHLLNSMSQVMLGFKSFMAGNVDAARYSMISAQDELENMEYELSRLGVTSFAVQELIH